MRCTQCEQELPAAARFCPQCGTPVPPGATIQVDQHLGTVKGDAVGTMLGDNVPSPGLSSTTRQTVDTVGQGGTVVGTVIGATGGTTQIGGQHHHGDTISGNINVGNVHGSGIAVGHGAQSSVRNITTGGGDYAEGTIDKRQGAFVSGGTVYGPVVGNNQGAISTTYGDTAGADAAMSLDQALQPLRVALEQLPPTQHAAALQAFTAIRSELARGAAADDMQVATLLDRLAGLSSHIARAALQVFATPPLAGTSGPVTQFVLDKLRRG